MTVPFIYLASSSPRRQELLDQIGVPYKLVTQSVAEQRLAGETPKRCVQRLAMAKAEAGRTAIRDVDQPVLGADTVVVVDDRILGKPRDEADGLEMLGLLSGRDHLVMSAVAMVGMDALGREKKGVVFNESRVWFRVLSDRECRDYWSTGEPLDKAGAYAVQGRAALFIERLEGSYSGVMGLPLYETAELLKNFGIDF